MLHVVLDTSPMFHVTFRTVLEVIILSISINPDGKTEVWKD